MLLWGGGGGGGGEFLPKRPENTACQPKQISGSRVGTKLKHCQNTKSILKPRGILNTLQENTEVHSCMTSYCNSMNWTRLIQCMGADDLNLNKLNEARNTCLMYYPPPPGPDPPAHIPRRSCKRAPQSIHPPEASRTRDPISAVFIIAIAN